VLAEIAIANAAWAVLKEGLSNGKSIIEMGASAADYFDATSVIDKKAQTEGSSSAAFFAREKHREQQEQLKEMLIWAGNAGQYDRFLEFKLERKREREAMEKAVRIKKMKRLKVLTDVVTGVCIFILSISGIGALLFVVWLIITKVYK
jgi:nitrate reductase NapE component